MRYVADELSIICSLKANLIDGFLDAFREGKFLDFLEGSVRQADSSMENMENNGWRLADGL